MRRFFEARKLHKNCCNTHGFTMAETLMTVAILGILAAVTFMGVFTIQRNMSQTRADKSAELIFEAAQRQMVSINAFDVQGQKDVSATSMLCAVPGDSRDPLPELLLKDQVADDLYHDGWIVEYEPTSLQVKAVYYFETGDMGFYNDPVTKAQVSAGRSERINYLKDNGQLVGYFAGEASAYSSSDLKLYAKLDVQNKEKLVANAGVVVYGDLPEGQKYKLVITTEGKTSKAKVTQEVEFANNDLVASTGKRIGGVSIVLDSLEAEKYRFRNTYGNLKSEGSFRSNNSIASGIEFLKDTTVDKEYINFSNITSTASITCSMEDGSNNFIPGEELTISVTAETIDGTLSDSVAYQVNSLYEKGEGSENNYIASLSAGRHLQNLDTQTSGFDIANFNGSQAVNKEVFNKIHAKQTASIDFSSATSDWIATYGTTQKKFRPITNVKLDEFSGGTKMGTYNITGLLVDAGNKSYAGLFAEYSGTKIENVTLINEKIKGADTTMNTERLGSIGGLVGKVAGSGTGLTIKGCQVYADTNGAKDGLDSAKANWMNHAINIGGLVGYALRDVRIENSSASTVITDASYVGGLVGYAPNVKVELVKSYADCYLSGNAAGGSNIGGLVGSCAPTSTVYACYSAGSIVDPSNSNNGAVAGIAPCEVASIRETYTLFDFGKGSAYSGTRFYPTVSVAGDVLNTYYVHASFDIPAMQKIGQDRKLSELANKSLTGFTPKLFAFVTDAGYLRSSQPYKLTSESSGLKIYPMPMIILDDNQTLLSHHGDWREGLRTLEVTFTYAGQVISAQNIQEYANATIPQLTADPNDTEYFKFVYGGEEFFYVPALDKIYRVSDCQGNISIGGIYPWTNVAPCDMTNPLGVVTQDMTVEGMVF